MLGINAIHRLIDAERYSEVIEGCLRSSMPLPLSIRLQLESSSSMRTSAIALGLTRIVDLSYRVTDGAQGLAAQLLYSQRDDGGFGGDSCPAVTVQALAALAAFRDRVARDPVACRAVGRACGSLEGVESAIARGCEHLVRRKSVPTEPMVYDRESTAYLLVMVARQPFLRGYLDAASIERDLFEAGCQHDRGASGLFNHARRLLNAADAEVATTPTAA